MSALATLEAKHVAAWTAEQKALIKRTVALEATDDELAMFLHIAAKSGLDPLQKQIHFTKRGGRVVVIAGIDGLQARAARSPDFEGIVYGVVCAQDDFLFDASKGEIVKHTYNAFADRGAVVGAWATVRRGGRLPFTSVVRFAEYHQPTSQTWKQMPHVMIAKVARSSALRLAYPEEFSAVYEEAEIKDAHAQQEEPRPQLVESTATVAAEPVTLEGRGKRAGVPLETFSMDELKQAVVDGENYLSGENDGKYRDLTERNLAKLYKELEARGQ